MNSMEIAAYLDRGADADAIERFEAHLAQCDACREDVVEARRVLGIARRPRRLLVMTGALAAAAMLVVVSLPVSRSDDQRWRAGDGGAGGLVAYRPLGEVGTDSFRFVWGAAPNVVSYRLTVTGTDGALVWTANTTDTSTTLEPGHPLVGGIPYYWAADALLDDGSSLTTGLRAFHLRR